MFPSSAAQMELVFVSGAASSSSSVPPRLPEDWEGHIFICTVPEPLRRLGRLRQRLPAAAAAAAARQRVTPTGGSGSISVSEVCRHFLPPRPCVSPLRWARGPSVNADAAENSSCLSKQLERVFPPCCEKKKTESFSSPPAFSHSSLPPFAPPRFSPSVSHLCLFLMSPPCPAPFRPWPVLLILISLFSSSTSSPSYFLSSSCLSPPPPDSGGCNLRKVRPG